MTVGTAGNEPRRYLSLGIPLGSLVDEPGNEVLSLVRLGGDSFGLTIPAFQVWLAALSAPEEKQLETFAESIDGIGDAHETIVDLSEEGLLLSHDPAEEDLAGRMQALRPLLCGIGFGNSPASLDEYEIADSRLEVGLRVDFPRYMIWCAIDSVGSLAACCTELADAHEGISLASWYAVAWAFLPQLMAARLLLLDRVAEPETAPPIAGTDAAQEQVGTSEDG
jgi:hypothetical protein